jgi:PPOX class probable F420-dependent enzyme
VGSAVDHKPKRSDRLRRLADIEASGAATVLVDHYEEDWSRLWWARVRGRAVVHHERDEEALAVVHALSAKYVQHRDHPPAGPVYRIALDEVRSWRSADPA